MNTKEQLRKYRKHGKENINKSFHFLFQCTHLFPRNATQNIDERDVRNGNVRVKKNYNK